MIRAYHQGSKDPFWLAESESLTEAMTEINVLVNVLNGLKRIPDNAVCMSRIRQLTVPAMNNLSAISSTDILCGV